MRCLPSWWLVTSLALATACGKSEDKAAGAPDDAATAEPTAPAGPAAIVTVIYNTPKDTAAFEKYYRDVHLPLMAALKKGIATPGFKKVAGDLPNFATGGLDGLVAVETR
jgi:hypothetical protein